MAGGLFCMLVKDVPTSALDPELVGRSPSRDAIIITRRHDHDCGNA